jgi:hypothetical protein
MPYKVIVPKGSAPPLAPYSPGTKALVEIASIAHLGT